MELLTASSKISSVSG